MFEHVLAWFGVLGLILLGLAACWGTYNTWLEKSYWVNKAKNADMKNLALRELGTDMAHTSYWYHHSDDKRFVEVLGKYLQEGYGYDCQKMRDKIQDARSKEENKDKVPKISTGSTFLS